MEICDLYTTTNSQLIVSQIAQPLILWFCIVFFSPNCLGFHTMNAACSLLIIAEFENMLREEKGQP